jgi:hypothetical protein
MTEPHPTPMMIDDDDGDEEEKEEEEEEVIISWGTAEANLVIRLS